MGVSDCYLVYGTIKDFEKYLEDKVWFINLYDKLEGFADFVGVYEGDVLTIRGVTFTGDLISALYGGGQLILRAVKKSFLTSSSVAKYIRSYYPRRFTSNTTLLLAWRVTSYRLSYQTTYIPGSRYFSKSWVMSSGPWTYNAW